MRRFYMERLTDQTGVSGTGKVLEGALLESGKVIVEWRSPHKTMGIYNSFEEFKTIHVDCHPDMNRVYFIDRKTPWHCAACGAGGMDGNFCQMCGSASTAFDKAYEGFEENERWRLEYEMQKINQKMYTALSKEEYQTLMEFRNLVFKLQS